MLAYSRPISLGVHLSSYTTPKLQRQSYKGKATKAKLQRQSYKGKATKAVKQPAAYRINHTRLTSALCFIGLQSV
jgi:hypothetical protein